jgi:hypothetical protein
MASRPARPTGDDGNPIFPSATGSDEDDVQGHVHITVEADQDEQDDGTSVG